MISLRGISAYPVKLHAALVFNSYKPNNEKVRKKVIYRGANEWNVLDPNIRNLDFKDFKCLQKKLLNK